MIVLDLAIKGKKTFNSEKQKLVQSIASSEELTKRTK